jgi:hypothetical protein
MDYIFEEDVFEVGAEIDAYCSRCKTDTPHTVLTKYEDEIRSVQCVTCNSTHAYRPPRGESEEDLPEPTLGRRGQGTRQKPSWVDAMSQLNLQGARLYTPADTYSEGDVLDHPVFGYGCVTEVVSDTKMEALFKDGQRILVHNRKDITIPLPAKRKPSPLPPELLRWASPPPKAKRDARGRAAGSKPEPAPRSKPSKPHESTPKPTPPKRKPTPPKPTPPKPTPPKPTPPKPTPPKPTPKSKPTPPKSTPPKPTPKSKPTPPKSKPTTPKSKPPKSTPPKSKPPKSKPKPRSGAKAKPKGKPAKKRK